MTESAFPDLEESQGELIAELEEGWAPLPNSTLLALVVGGLKVRMMRSIVTMVSIVLAIAFLVYTGLSNKLYINLAEEVRRLGQPVRQTGELRPARGDGRDDPARSGQRRWPHDPARSGQRRWPHDSAMSAVQRADLFSGLSPESRREAALGLGLGEVYDEKLELGGLGGPLRKARLNREDADRELAEIEADPDAFEASVEAARKRAEGARRDLETREERRQILSEQIELCEWLASGRDQGNPDMSRRLLRAMAKEKERLLGGGAGLGRLNEDDLDRVTVLFGLVGSTTLSRQRGPAERPPGAGETVEALQKMLDEARTKLAASKLRMKFRRAGISVESTVEGDTLNTWLIVMALLTCTVGITNAVLMSVTERFREIGTMKCLGAQDSLVVKMFLLEAGMLGGVGALLGVALGIVVVLAAGLLQFGAYGFTCFPLAQGASVIGWSLLAGIFISVIGAAYPTLVAARMEPVDALRADE